MHLVDGKAGQHSAMEGGLERLPSLEWWEGRGCYSAECPGKARPAIEVWPARITLPQVQTSSAGSKVEEKGQGCPTPGMDSCSHSSRLV